MVSLAELFGSSFIYFLLFTVTLLALWSYVIFAKGTVLPLDPSLLKKDDTLSDKRATKKRSKNKRVRLYTGLRSAHMYMTRHAHD